MSSSILHLIKLPKNSLTKKKKKIGGGERSNALVNVHGGTSKVKVNKKDSLGFIAAHSSRTSPRHQPLHIPTCRLTCKIRNKQNEIVDHKKTKNRNH